MRFTKFAAAAAFAALPALAHAAPSTITVSVEDAGVQATTKVSPAHVETFADAVAGENNGTGTPYLDTFTSTFGGSGITGTFEGFELGLPDSYGGNGYLYGGAFGSDQYGVVHGTATITLSTYVRYFGLWAAALDGNNTIELLRDGDLLGSYGLTSTIGQLGSAYYGNPNNGGDANEAFAFVNFESDVAFNQIRFVQSGGGFEFDNVTIGGAVPEPATWGMMLLGFGMTGAALRTRRRVAATA